MAGLFETHDREISLRFMHIPMGQIKMMQMRQRLIEAFDVFDDVREMTDAKIALLARQDKIDIAIDLNGYTAKSRSGIFALSSCPHSDQLFWVTPEHRRRFHGLYYC